MPLFVPIPSLDHTFGGPDGGNAEKMRRPLSERRQAMKARAGDRLVVEGIHVGDARRVGVITAVSHADGSPPYTVRWPDGHETLVFPGSEAHVEPSEAEPLPG
jgi:hypothetical protein